MKKMILLFSHTLSEKQREEATQLWNVSEFVSLPKELQNIWSNIPYDVETLDNILKPIRDYMAKISNKDDVVLVQGDFGAVSMLVNESKSLGLVPVYATTKRTAKEYITKEGKQMKKSIFEHRRFRKYE